MNGIFDVVLAVLLLASFATLFAYFVVAIVVVARSLRQARRSSRLSDDLDRVLVDILGPRSASTLTPETHTIRGRRPL